MPGLLQPGYLVDIARKVEPDGHGPAVGDGSRNEGGPAVVVVVGGDDVTNGERCVNRGHDHEDDKTLALGRTSAYLRWPMEVHQSNKLDASLVHVHMSQARSRKSFPEEGEEWR